MKSSSFLKDKKVSVVIPSYNKHDYLREAVVSVLQQSHDNMEIIIVNDYPSEIAREELELIQKVDSQKIKVFHNEKNLGIAASRNVAVSKASGEYLAMLDHDDVRCDHEKLEKQLDILAGSPEIYAIGSQYYKIDKDGNILGESKLPLSDQGVRNCVNKMMPTLLSSLVLKKNIVERIGGFDTRVSMTDDYAIVFKLLQKGRVENLPDYTTYYRVNNNTSLDPKNAIIMNIYALKLLLQNGTYFPHYASAVFMRASRVPYAIIRPFLPEGVRHILRRLVTEIDQLLPDRTTI